MRILIITQYFWPENFRINDLALGLKERGHEIAVLTGKPNYPGGTFFKGYSFFKKRREEWNGIPIYRSPLIPRKGGKGIQLMFNYLSFAFFATLRSFGIREEFDKIFVFEPSPITVGIPAIIYSKRKRIPIYFWVQDLWPESIKAAGQIKNAFILKRINKLTQWIYSNSKTILIQSEGFRQYILNQGVSNDKIIYYPNSTEGFYKPVCPGERIRGLIPAVPFKILFAGNIGEAQDFDTILNAAAIVQQQNRDIHFIILGNGRKRPYVEEQILKLGLTPNFHLLGSFPVQDMPDFFSCADALLVTLKKDEIFALTIPSKLQSYLACAKPIIAALDGEGAKIIRESKAGFVSPSGDAGELARHILKMYDLGENARARASENAKRYFLDNFERETLINKLLEIFSVP